MSTTDFDYIHGGVKENEDLDNLLRKRKLIKNVFGDIPPEIAELALTVAKAQKAEEKKKLEQADPFDHAREIIGEPKKDDRYDY